MDYWSGTVLVSANLSFNCLTSTIAGSLILSSVLQTDGVTPTGASQLLTNPST